MNILFVCTVNTCRSPIAEGYLSSLNIPDITVKSRGLQADGLPISENSRLVLKEIGIDFSSHISKTITAEDITKADKIYCMSPSHLSFLEMYCKDKLSLLGDGIADPFGGDLDTYRKCRDQITAQIDRLFLPFTVREIDRNDIKQIAYLEKLCFSEPWSENVILEHFSAGTKFFMAEKDNTCLGYIGISCILDEGYITNIAVFPEYRKKGVATALLKKCFALPLRFISLEVRASNITAISLYEKLGFISKGRRKSFYSSPQEDALILTKRFEEK